MQTGSTSHTNNWQAFWSSKPELFGSVMQRNAVFFTNILLKNKIIQEGQRILDYGCGWGSLAIQLKGIAAYYQGLDISKACIDSCKQLFTAEQQFHFDTIDAQTPEKNLEPFISKNEQFDLIIILSVIQYFEDISKVELLLANCKKLLVEKGKIILADVIQPDKGLMKDIISNLKDSIKNGYFFSFILFMIKARFSSYHQIRVKNNLLSLSEADVAGICKKLNLHYEPMPVCTLQHSRVSYCITNSSL